MEKLVNHQRKVTDNISLPCLTRENNLAYILDMSFGQKSPKLILKYSFYQENTDS